MDALGYAELTAMEDIDAEELPIKLTPNDLWPSDVWDKWTKLDISRIIYCLKWTFW